MPPQGFFAGATGNNQILKRLLAWQAADGVPIDDIAAFVPFLSNGGAVAPSPAYLERLKISSNPMRGNPLVSTLDIQNGTLDMGDLDAGDKAQAMLLLSYFQRYLTTNPSGAHYRHRLSANQTNLFKNKLTYINDIDEGIPARYMDLIVGGWTLVVKSKQNVQLTFTVFPGKLDHWETPEPDGGNAGEISPLLLHFTAGNWAPDATDKDAYIKIISDTATTVTFQAKEAAAGTYSASQTVNKGEHSFVWLGAAAAIPYGNRAQQILAYFPTAGADGEYVADDFFVYAKRRVIPTLTYATQRTVAEVQCRFYLDGTFIGLDEGITITAGLDEALTRYSPGSEQPLGTYRSGFQNISVAVGRRKENLELQKALMTRGVKSLVVECKTDALIGATAAYYGDDFVFPNLFFTGTRHDVESGGQNRTESLVLLAKETATPLVWRGMNFTADCEVVRDTDYATVHTNPA
jgi:hypothetical protein